MNGDDVRRPAQIDMRKLNDGQHHQEACNPPDWSVAHVAASAMCLMSVPRRRDAVGRGRRQRPHCRRARGRGQNLLHHRYEKLAQTPYEGGGLFVAGEYSVSISAEI